MRCEEKEGIVLLRFETCDFPGLVHWFVTRRVPFDVQRKEGRRALEAYLGIGPIFVAHQVHGAEVFVLEDDSPPFSIFADALLTCKKNRYLGVLVADCVPLLLFASQEEVLGVVHAGWRGIVEGVHKKAVEVMKERFAVSPSSLWAGVGPAIGPCCFAVGSEVAECFRILGKEAFVKERRGRFFVDLEGVVVEDLVLLGLKRERIEVSRLCTACGGDLFYSFRRDGTQGRCLLLAGMRG